MRPFEARVLRACWGGPETLIVVSSDLSHFHDHQTATKMDGAAAQALLGHEAALADGVEDGVQGRGGHQLLRRASAGERRDATA